MKRLSLQWRITLMTVLLIGITCVAMNLLLCSSGVYYMDTIADSLQGGSTVILNDGGAESFDPQLIAPNEELTIVVDGAQGRFRTTNWYITAAVTLLSGILAYFVSGRALKPLRSFASQVEQVQLNNLADMRIDEDTISEFRQLSRSFNQMLERLNNAFAAQRQFTGNAAHELRTPLTSIKGWGETLAFAENDNEDEITRKGLQVIVHEAGRLEGFVEELLDFSRLQSGRMKLRLAPTDIFAELDETVFTFRERAMREGIELKYSIPDLPAPANADANRLKQVFMNILDNALKYSRAPAKIFVKAEFAKKGGQDYVKIAVADQGCGISKENLPHVKEKFYKANMSVRGSGIGLAVTNELVELHGGTLEIDSEEGTGTLVTIYLPINSAPSKKDLAQQPQTAETREVDQSMELRGNNANAGEKNA